MNATMTETRSNGHDNTTSGLGFDGAAAVLFGADGAVRMPRGDDGRSGIDGERSQAQLETDELNESPLMARLIALGMPVFAWAALGVMYVNHDIATTAMIVIGAAGAALIVAVSAAKIIGRGN